MARMASRGGIVTEHSIDKELQLYIWTLVS